MTVKELRDKLLEIPDDSYIYMEAQRENCPQLIEDVLITEDKNMDIELGMHFLHDNEINWIDYVDSNTTNKISCVLLN